MGYGNTSGNSTKKSQVNDKQYITALKNIDNVKIMQKASSKYRGSLDIDEIKSCQMIGLWKAMEKFDENHGIKFTTFLYNVVRNECRKRIRQSTAEQSYPNFYSTPVAKLENFFSEAVDSLNYPLNKIIELRYMDSMTLKEIGKELGMTKNTIRRNIQKALKQIKKEWI